MVWEGITHRILRRRWRIYWQKSSISIGDIYSTAMALRHRDMSGEIGGGGGGDNTPNISKIKSYLSYFYQFTHGVDIQNHLSSFRFQYLSTSYISLLMIIKYECYCQWQLLESEKWIEHDQLWSPIHYPCDIHSCARLPWSVYHVPKIKIKPLA